MAKQDALNLEITVAWWFRFYVWGVMAMCTLTNSEPDEDKTFYWARKAIKAKINGKRVKVLQ